MLFSRINYWFQSFINDPIGSVFNFLFFAVALLVSLVMHECAHGWVALKCGDPTAKAFGRMTLDPRKHIDPIGALCMVFLGIGWAKPVPVNPNNFRNRKRDILMVSFAGIFVNLMMFLICLFLWTLSLKTNAFLMNYIRLFLQYMYTFNISLAVFNLIPIPPLDGFRILNQIGFKGELNIDDKLMVYVRYGFLFICISGVLGNAFSNVCNICISTIFNLFVKLIF